MQGLPSSVDGGDSRRCQYNGVLLGCGGGQYFLLEMLEEGRFARTRFSREEERAWGFGYKLQCLVELDVLGV